MRALSNACWKISTGNAIKYTMEGGWVKLTAREVPEGVEMAITDNGRGILPRRRSINCSGGEFQQVRAEDRAVGFGNRSGLLQRNCGSARKFH